MSDPVDIPDSQDFPELMTRDLPEGLRLVRGGVTAAPGYRAGSVACGIKSDEGTPDLAMFAADRPCVTVGTFTTSRTPSHTVTLCREHLAASGQRGQAVVVNSGNANCSNGERGKRDAERMAELTASKLGIDPLLVMVSSTGIIGRPLPMEKVERGIADVQIAPDGGDIFAQGIITTDTRVKTVAVEFDVGGRTVRLGGSTKGAGMIYPNMATMLCYLTTDLALDPAFSQSALRAAVADSFNMICVDGDMSTNDTVLLFANGLAENIPLATGVEGVEIFVTALRYVTRYLAREIARDGEGATKLMTVQVMGAASVSDARRVARAITGSPLWQCAVAGGDPNWGRVMGAIGASGAEVDPDKVAITLGQVAIVRNGYATDYDQAAAKQAVAGSEVLVDVDLGLGAYSATAWGCDLTHGYIEENTTYTR
ncbi:MAG TPA: bifunctional glutamate N-acetyltransferase/amino-acid acetyltransferase ArgJ [Ktedonobacterales bacterium]|nr:bifunctional glutamate N-acetyltransferase/amino-acid acetyltransferase ArgJ [Ktedonobacterales bacterium]